MKIPSRLVVPCLPEESVELVFLAPRQADWDVQEEPSVDTLIRVDCGGGC